MQVEKDKNKVVDKSAIKLESKKEKKEHKHTEDFKLKDDLSLLATKETSELKSKLQELQDQLMKEKSDHTKDKEATESANKKSAELEGDLKKEKEQLSKEQSDNKKTSEDLSKIKKDYESLRSKHDAEVQELFENKDTLKFVK